MEIARPLALLALSAALVACGDDTSGSGGAGSGTGGAGAGGGPATTSGAGGDPSGTSQGSTTSTTSSTSSTTGSGGGGGQGGGDTTTVGSGGSGGAVCDGEGFVAATEDAGEIGGAFLYFALESEAAPSDDLAIELYSDLTTTGAREILEENYAVCDPCVLLRTDCDESLDNCAKRFLARAGTIDVQAWDDVFQGELRDVELVEVTIDDEATSTPVPGGEVWCIESYLFDAVVQ